MFKLTDLIEQPMYNDASNLREFSEDAYIFTPNLVAIADGITSKSKGDRWIGEGHSDAYWLVQTFLNSLKEIALKREETGLDDAKEILKLAMEKTISMFHPIKTVGKADKPSCSFSMVMQHLSDRNKFTFVNIGGNYIFYNDKYIELSPTLKAMDASLESDMKTNVKKGFFLTDKRWFKILREKVFYTNTSKGYPAVDLTYDWLEHPESVFVTEQLNVGDKIMLSTDGLTRSLRLYNLYKESNFMENCLDKGLANILKEQRDIELSDWDRIKYPRFMSTMDICALTLSVKSD